MRGVVVVVGGGPSKSQEEQGGRRAGRQQGPNIDPGSSTLFSLPLLWMGEESILRQWATMQGKLCQKRERSVLIQHTAAGAGEMCLLLHQKSHGGLVAFFFSSSLCPLSLIWPQQNFLSQTKYLLWIWFLWFIHCLYTTVLGTGPARQQQQLNRWQLSARLLNPDSNYTAIETD